MKESLDESWDKEIINVMQTGRHRFREILALIPNSLNYLKVLDVGTTPFTFLIKGTYPHYEITTLDLTSLAEDMCVERGIKFQAHDLEKLPLPFETDTFDIIILTEVVEHLIILPSEVLGEFYRIIRPAGKLIFSVPNLAALIKRLKLLFGQTPLPPPDEQMTKGLHGYGHPREYTMQECLTILKACGFNIQAKKYQHPGLSMLIKASSGKIILPLTLLHYLVCWLVPSFRATIFVVAAKV